jgi:hypothetical protein
MERSTEVLRARVGAEVAKGVDGVERLRVTRPAAGTGGAVGMVSKEVDAVDGM